MPFERFSIAWHYNNTSTKPEIHAVLQNATLRYSQVWEDYELLFDGLDLEPTDHVVSIGSAGDNALALLARGVASVSSVDLNPAQTALCELKKVAISKVDYAEFADLLGVGNPRNGHFKSITPSSPSSLSVVLPIGRAIRIFCSVEFAFRSTRAFLE